MSLYVSCAPRLQSTDRGSHGKSSGSTAPAGACGHRDTDRDVRRSDLPPGDPYHGQPLGCRGGRPGRLLDRGPNDRHVQRRCGLGSWLYRITANCAYTKLRVRRARHHASSFDEVSATVDEDPPSVHDWSAKVEDPALQVELRRVLTVALDTLPEDHRAIVVLRDVEGLSPEEVSQITGLSIPAVKTRTHRARLVLRKWLGEYFSDRPMSLPASPAASSSSPRRQRSSASKRAGRRSGRAKALLA